MVAVAVDEVGGGSGSQWLPLSSLSLMLVVLELFFDAFAGALLLYTRSRASPPPPPLQVHAPVAPTQECVRLVEELGEEVRYIVLPTTAVREGKGRGRVAKGRARGRRKRWGDRTYRPRELVVVVVGSLMPANDRQEQRQAVWGGCGRGRGKRHFSARSCYNGRGGPDKIGYPC